MKSLHSSGFCKSVFVLAPLALVGVLAGQQPAQAVLTYYLYEEQGNSYIETSGSLNLPTTSTGIYSCEPALYPFGAYLSTTSTTLPIAVFALCTGISTALVQNEFLLTSPSPNPAFAFPAVYPPAVADAGSGLPTYLSIAHPAIGPTAFATVSSYINNTPIISQSIFYGKSLGFTTPGLVGTWTITGTTETIDVVVGSKPVPGPLPILGAGAAYSWSRRLRRRIQAKI